MESSSTQAAEKPASANRMDDDLVEKVTNASRGLTESEVENLYAKLIVSNKGSNLFWQSSKNKFCAFLFC